MNKVNTLLIGVGYHSRRIYIPILKESKHGNLVACLDLESQKENIQASLTKLGVEVPCYYTKNDKISDSLSTEELQALDVIVRTHKVEAVIISTEPLAHFKYSHWALKKGLHVLLDKPITTEIDVSTNEKAARKIFSDYTKLVKLYRRKSLNNKIVFTLQAQRRFHKGFQCAREKIKEIYKLTNCPVTSIQTFHSDGQWRFPKEIIEQSYHPYNQGYGKMSHSGYHSLDMSLWLAEGSLDENKKWDEFKVYAEFVRPKDLLAQFNIKDYLNIFPDLPVELLNTNIEKRTKKISGEVDSFANISLLKDSNSITNISCNCLHNGFGQRNWVSTENRDLYKGNGRVRQESYIIEQGPFQSIIINSFQSNEILKSGLPSYEVGGEHHFDVHIFRNSSLFSQLKSYERHTIKDLSPVKDLSHSVGHNEKARGYGVLEFYQSILNNVPDEKQSSGLVHHSLGTQILSSIYLSASKQYNGKNPVIRGKII